MPQFILYIDLDCLREVILSGSLFHIDDPENIKEM